MPKANRFSLETRVHVVRQPDKPFVPGSKRARAWLIMQAMDGYPLKFILEAWLVMEEAQGAPGKPITWLELFLGERDPLKTERLVRLD
ncbi:MAG: hypothetical protein IPM80_22275 [Proteobacteria bacterium]|jgi:hypothetical protein|nr:hypothetical protein [Pseudomonadota bacterium]